MIRVIRDGEYNFTTMFNDKTGEYIRAFDVEEDPFMAEYPHLIDVGLMGNCAHGKSGLCMKAGIKCYQDGLHSDKPNMKLEDYKKIIDWSKERLFEIALGGCGDPDMHENFEEVLKYTRDNGIIPNFTTSGLGMTPEKAALCKKYCGAVAVSQYSRLDMIPDLALRRVHSEDKKKVYKSEDDIPVLFTLGGLNEDCKWDEPCYKINGLDYSWDETHHMYYGEDKQEYEFYKVYNEVQKPNYTMRAIKMLLDAGVKTNIHYVLSNSTIDEAILRVKYNGFPKGINAVVFLLHKPVGLGDYDDVLKLDDPRVKEFFELVDNHRTPFKIGFDSCSIPAVVRWSKHIDTCSVDTCEGSRFSMYIAADMTALPCSFDNQDQKYAVKLSDEVTIKDAWESPEFNKFRDCLRYSCKGCPKRELCMGGCPLVNDIVLCDNKERKFYGG